jgi:hypothetical protein
VFDTLLVQGASACRPEVLSIALRRIIGAREGPTDEQPKDQISLSKVFSGRDRQLVQGMYGDWYRVRGNLMAALQERRLAEVDEALPKLARMNRTYLDVATRRYHEFVTSDELVAPSYETDPARVLRKPVNRETDGSARSRCLEATMGRIAEEVAPPSG